MAIHLLRSTSTNKLRQVLTTEPQTIPALAASTGISLRGTRSALNILIGLDVCVQIDTRVDGKAVKMYALAPPRKGITVASRGDYTPPPLPLRYEPRDIVTVTVGPNFFAR